MGRPLQGENQGHAAGNREHHRHGQPDAQGLRPYHARPIRPLFAGGQRGQNEYPRQHFRAGHLHGHGGAGGGKGRRHQPRHPHPHGQGGGHHRRTARPGGAGRANRLSGADPPKLRDGGADQGGGGGRSQGHAQHAARSGWPGNAPQQQNHRPHGPESHQGGHQDHAGGSHGGGRHHPRGGGGNHRRRGGAKRPAGKGKGAACQKSRL